MTLDPRHARPHRRPHPAQAGGDRRRRSRRSPPRRPSRRLLDLRVALRLPVQVADGLVVCTVVGFPSGAHESEVKAHEAALAVARGAQRDRHGHRPGRASPATGTRWRRTSPPCGPAAARPAQGHPREAALTPEQIVEACRRSEAGGAQYVKTSTGFHPAGGAPSRRSASCARRSATGSASRRAAASATPPRRSRCSTPAPPARPVRHPGRARRPARLTVPRRGQQDATMTATPPIARRSPVRCW